MSGVAYPAEALDHAGRRINADVGRIRQQILLGAYKLIIFIHNELLAEDIGAVLYEDAVRIDRRAEFHSLLKLLKQADEVDILGSRQLHARHGDYPVLLRRFIESGAVAAGIVVGERHDIEPCDHAHARNIVGGHVVVAAG